MSATSLLVDVAGTETGGLVSVVVAWVRRQLTAEARCTFTGCSEAGEWQPVDGGPGARCADHVDVEPTTVIGEP